MIAVNGTIPGNFRIHITSDGYTWVPNTIYNRAPEKDTVHYVQGAVDETFTASDFSLRSADLEAVRWSGLSSL